MEYTEDLKAHDEILLEKKDYSPSSKFFYDEDLSIDGDSQQQMRSPCGYGSKEAKGSP